MCIYFFYARSFYYGFYMRSVSAKISFGQWKKVFFDYRFAPKVHS